ncbi:MAG: hypothetical protein IKO21_09335 [Fibrobacter sp.]|nr:hypothetical protein [Fibrobacter sp.]
MQKFFLLLAVAALLCSCFTPSRVEPSVKVYTFNNMGRTYVSSRTVFIPVPLPFKYEFGGAWDIRFSAFSLEQEFSSFFVQKGNKTIAIRGARKDYFAKDSTFTKPFDVSDEEFVMYYLDWDMDYWKEQVDKNADAITGHELNYTAGKATYNSEKKYGTISRALPYSKTCTLASVQKNDYIYMITGSTSIDDNDDMCEVVADIWEDRAEF